MICDLGVFRLFANDVFGSVLRIMQELNCVLNKLMYPRVSMGAGEQGLLFGICQYKYFRQNWCHSRPALLACVSLPKPLSLDKVITLSYRHTGLGEEKGMYSLFYLCSFNDTVSSVD
jgi:hypothetical protein